MRKGKAEQKATKRKNGTVLEEDAGTQDPDEEDGEETVNGYVLTDNGVIGRASKNLVVLRERAES